MGIVDAGTNELRAKHGFGRVLLVGQGSDSDDGATQLQDAADQGGR
jgi:hypothetical protein